MTKLARTYLPVLLILCVATLAGGAELRLGTPVTAAEPAAAAQWGAWIDGQVTGGTWRLVVEQRDADFPGRYHRRYEQLVGGATVFGSGLARQVDADGATRTVFGYRYDNIALDTVPCLTVEEAQRAVVEAMGAGSQAVGEVRLTILPLDTGTYLTYMLWGWRVDPPSLMRYFIDARTGAVVFAYENLKTETPVVGIGSGVWSDRKKLGANYAGSTYLLEDLLRPARFTTYNMRFDLNAYNYGSVVGYEATDADNDWSDGAAVDAHANAGATYDYYYARHGRHGIDDHDMPVKSFVHVLSYYINAFWSDYMSAMTYGDGGYSGGAMYMPLSCAIDVVAHEMTHGVTSRTWDGIYWGESGALNEALSDVMGLGAEFYLEPVGDGRKKADYWMGEDLSDPFDPPRFAFRSAANPSLFCHGFACDPDHYSKRYLGSTDNAGVHVNSGIANQAFYLLIEGGTNRTSGITVTGIGAANREKAEKIFYRGFTKYLTPSATFRNARAATIQAAVDLYGSGSNEATRVAQAWTAVGVE
jgi:bacillolysin